MQWYRLKQKFSFVILNSISSVTQIAKLPKMKLYHITSLSQRQCQHRTVLQTSLSFWVLKYRETLSWINDNQFARCGAKADRFPFNKSPIVENMFSTGTEDALWLGVSLASSCSSGNLLDLNEARDDGVMLCSNISWTVCKQPSPRSRQITTPTPHHSILYRSDAVLSGLVEQNSAIHFPSWLNPWNTYYGIPRNVVTQNYNLNHYNTSTCKTRSSAIAEGPRDASCQLKTCQLPRNSAETTYTTSTDQIDGMKLEI